MSTLENAVGQARSAAASVGGVVDGLDGVGSELDDAISQFHAIGVDGKAAEAEAAKGTVDALKNQAASLKDGIDSLAAEIQAISG